MGSMTDARVEAFQKRTGIEPATGEQARLLEKMSQAAYAMIRIIELERSGIRDGDGFWHGSDVVGGMAHEMIALCKQLLAPSQFDVEKSKQVFVLKDGTEVEVPPF